HRALDGRGPLSLESRVARRFREMLVRERDGDITGQMAGKDQIAIRVRAWKAREQCENADQLIVDGDRDAQTGPQAAFRPGHSVEQLRLIGVAERALLSAADQFRRSVAGARIETKYGRVLGRQREIRFV